MSSLLLQIEGALADLYSPTTTSSRRQEVEAHLESFRAQTPDAWRPALEFLQLSSTPASPSLQMMYYASSVIDHFATPKIHDSLPPQTQSELLSNTLTTLSNTYLHLHPSAATKLLAAYTRLLRNSTTQADTAQVSSLLATLSSSPTPLLLHILSVLVDEFAAFPLGKPLRGAHRHQITVVLKTVILPALPAILPPLLTAPTLPPTHTLQTLATVLSYPVRYQSTRTMDITPLISLPLLQSLFALAAPPPNAPPAAEAPLALECINEIVSRNCWPSNEGKNFVLLICSHALSLISSCSSPDTLPSLPEEYITQLLNFLSHFASRHLPAALSSPSFNMPDFLLASAGFTFSLPNPCDQTQALSIWIRIAEFLESFPESHKFLEQNEQGLSSVLDAAIKTCTYTHSPALLDLLDGGDTTFPTFSPSTDAPSSSDDEPSSSPSDDSDSCPIIDDSMDAALRESELGTLLAEASILTKILSSLSSLSTLSAFSLTSTLLSSTLSSLNAALSSASPTSPLSTTQLCWDACVSLRLLQTSLAAAAVFHCSDTHFSQFVDLATNLTSFCAQLTSSRIWQHQPTTASLITFINLTLSSLNTTLWAWSPQSPMILSSASSFSDSLLTLTSSFFSAANTLPAPYDVTLSFCNLLKSVSDIFQFHNNAIPQTPEFSAARIAAATASMQYAPNVDPSLSSIIYRSCVNLTFSEGFTQTRSKEPSPNFTNQAAAFSTIVLKVLCNELLTSTNAVKSLAPFTVPVDPRTLLPLSSSIYRTTAALTAITTECSAMGPDGRQQIQTHMSAVISDLLDCSTIFTSLTMGGGATSSINSASSSILLLLLAVMDSLGRDLGVEFKTQTLSRLMSAFDREAQTPTITPSLISVVLTLLKMFKTIFSERSASLTTLAGDACKLISSRLSSLCKDPLASPELLPSLLDTIHCILLTHWKGFTTTTMEASADSPVSSSHPLFRGGKKRVTRIIDEARYQLLTSLLDVFMFGIKADSLPPSCVASAVFLLRDLGSQIALFKLPEFQASLKLPFVTTLLEDLLKMNSPTLVDPMSELLFEIASAVDINDFFQSLLPSIINGMSIGNAEKQQVLDSWNSQETTRLSFIANAANFLSEFKYHST